MNRRLIYAILVVIILILLFNYVSAPQGVIATVNLVAALCFGILLLYKYSRFRAIDSAITAANEKYGVCLDDLKVDEDDIADEVRDW